MTHGDHGQRRFEVPENELADGFAAVMDSLDRLTEEGRRDLELQADCAVRGHEAYLEGLDLLERGKVDDARHRLHIALHHHVPGFQGALKALDGIESAADGPVSHPTAVAGDAVSLPVIPVLGDVPQSVRAEAVGVRAEVTHGPASAGPARVPAWNVVGTAAPDEHLEHAEQEHITRLASPPGAAEVRDQRQFREQLKKLRIVHDRSRRISPSGRPGRLDEAQKQSEAAISLVLNQDALPPWDFVADYLDACDLTPTEYLHWRRTWLELDSTTGTASQPRPEAALPGEQGEDPDPCQDMVVHLHGRTAPTAGERTKTKRPVARHAQRMARATTDARSSVRERPGHWVKWLHHHSVVAACAVLAVLAVSWCLKPLHDQGGTRQIEALRKQRCGTLNPMLVTRPDGECTGVTDGSDNFNVFGSELRQVLKAMAAENSKVQAVPHVTVALLAPLSPNDVAGGLASDQYVDEVEGAYTAVEQANASDSTVKIRLVLANMGADERYWKDTVDQLKAERDLMAVTGMGSGRWESVQAARELSKAGIPMVADTVGADGFDTTGTIDGRGRINGLVRAGFANRTLLAAAADDLPGGTHTAALVKASGTGDVYAQSLYRDFLAGLKERLNSATDFTFDPGGSLSVALPALTQELCSTGRPIDTVYFAAPERYLPAFLTALSRRSCHNQPVTVVAGPGTAGLSGSTLAGLHEPEAPITVLYPSLSDSEALSSSSNGNHELYRDFLQAFNSDHHGQTFPPGHATRGYVAAVIAHDAVVTAATAIRNATPATGQPQRQAVLDRLYALTGNVIQGASGRFGIDPITGNRTTTPITTYHLGSTS
ncbi:hypothetical protein ABT052_39650 [Streptomyces sp. NPDC002766]|uniref:ABC transporter substrate-binding protein n=1 Tax=unclassified Streptomyces TaxID=2593676 RepID=UPI003324E86B